MDRDLGILGVDVLHQIFVPLDLEFGMHPPLKKDLRAADFQQLFDLSVDLFEAEHIDVFVVAVAIKGAKFAIDPAAVGVVDVAIDDEGGDPFGMERLFLFIRHAPQLLQIAVAYQLYRLFGRHSAHSPPSSLLALEAFLWLFSIASSTPLTNLGD